MKIDRLKVGNLKTNVWFIEGEAPEGATPELIIIDPGDEPDRIFEMIAGRRVAGVLLTHGHYDHMRYADEVSDETGSFLYCTVAEAEMMDELCEDIVAQYGGELKAPIIDFELNDGDMLSLAGLDIEVMLTPGHTRGSCGYLIEEPGNGQLHYFSGDTLFARDFGRTDLLGGDPVAMEASLERIARELPGQTKVYPGHGPATTIAREAAANSWWPIV